MQILELVGSAKRKAAEDSPVKNAFDKVKSACSGGSVAVAEIGHAVTAIRLRRRMAADETYEKISGQFIPSREFILFFGIQLAQFTRCPFLS